MNPFTSLEYWQGNFIPYQQNDALPLENPGICFALGLEWLKDFFADVAKQSHFLEHSKDLDFINKIIENQHHLSLPVSWADYQFKTELGRLIKPYHLERAPLRELSGASDFAKEMQEGNKAALFFLKKDFLDGKGHVIFVASRKKNANGLEVAIFDANYGELTFYYDLSIVNLAKKTVTHVDEFNETWHSQSIKTYEHAVNDLISFYKEPEELQKKGEKHPCYLQHKTMYLLPKKIDLSLNTDSLKQTPGEPFKVKKEKESHAEKVLESAAKTLRML